MDLENAAQGVAGRRCNGLISGRVTRLAVASGRLSSLLLAFALYLPLVSVGGKSCKSIGTAPLTFKHFESKFTPSK